MCGICGIVNLASGKPPDTALLLRMMGRLKHRGPDSSGFYRDRWAALGHTRLAIIDLSGGAQPLANEDGSLWVTYNGEIFNYVELADELKALGHLVRTKSDTEVIVHAFEQWGTGCFSRFNGQWAIALWDKKTRILTLSRDRLGVRPLYYAVNGQRLLFGSEIKALFADEGLERAFDPLGLGEIFTFWGTVAPKTVFKNISELQPGHYATVRDGRIESNPYWSVAFPVEEDSHPGARRESEEENARRLEDLLITASRLRFLRSDVPVGAYLSGGIDSSITSAIVARYTEAPLKTFSIRFEDPEFDEGTYQAEMVRRLGTDHRDVRVSRKDIGEVFPSVVWHAERPILRTAPAPLFLLSRLVRSSGYKVVVTGEGSDEVLAGYDIFREARVRLFLARDPRSKKRAQILERLYPWMHRSPGNVPAFARAFFSKDLDPSDPGFSHRPRWETTSAIKSMLSPEYRDEISRDDAPARLLGRLPPEAAEWDPLCRAQWLEYVTLLSGYILSAQGDRMLMAHSVEGRFPFLDSLLVDFANGLPPRHKLLALDEKHLLKAAFRDLVPPAILTRPKQPYRAPDAASFFHKEAPDWVDEMVSDSSLKRAGIFEADSVRLLVSKCGKVEGAKMSNTDNMRIVGVLSAMLTHHHFIERDGRGERDERPPEPVTAIDTLREIER